MPTARRPESDPQDRSAGRLANRLDRVAIGLSGLCLVHCVATVLLAATLASAGAALANPAFHEIGFTLAILIGAVALGRGFLAHRDRLPLLLGGIGLGLMGVGIVAPEGAAEIASTMAGVVLLALAHRRNAHHAAHHGGRTRHLAGGVAEA